MPLARQYQGLRGNIKACAAISRLERQYQSEK
jgi:hypothetical protein